MNYFSFERVAKEIIELTVLAMRDLGDDQETAFHKAIEFVADIRGLVNLDISERELQYIKDCLVFVI